MAELIVVIGLAGTVKANIGLGPTLPIHRPTVSEAHWPVCVHQTIRFCNCFMLMNLSIVYVYRGLRTRNANVHLAKMSFSHQMALYGL